MSATQPLLGAGTAQHGEDDQSLHVHVEVERPATKAPEVTVPHPSPTRGTTLFIGIVGALLTTAAVVLHFSGWEKVDLSFQDDRCYQAPNISYSGLPVDACLNRQSSDQATDCGVAAANAFCVQEGGNYHVNFTIAERPLGKLGTISLGNMFIGGKLSFSEICCDVGRYEPAWSRLILAVGGTALLYWLAALAAHMLLGLLEVLSAWLELDAGEVLYFLLGMETPASWVLFSSCLLWWVDYTLWVVWCEAGVDCEAHGSTFRRQVYNFAEVVLLFSVGSFFAKAAPRIISMRYLYAGQFRRVRDTMRKESLLAALTRSEVREIVQARRDQQHHAQHVAAEPGAASAAMESGAAGVGSTPQPASGTRQFGKTSSRKGAGGGGSRGRGGSGGSNRAELRNLLEIVGVGSSGAVARFRNFLNHYSTATEDDLAEEASAEGEVLFDNLVGAWDVNDDGAVGLQDFEELFRRVRPPPGFRTARDAARQAWEMFDLDLDGRLGREEVIKALAAIYLDRANTARTVLSNESAVRSLEGAIGFVLYTLLLFAAANILGITLGTSESQSSLDFFTTYILALSFIFGDTVRSVFRSTLYLFAEQPFAVGDYLEIEDELWCVEAFDLIYTQLRKWEYNQYAKVPNDMLIDSKLVNVSRGGAFKDTVPLSAPMSMSMESLKNLKDLLVKAGEARPKDIVADSPHVKVDSIDSGQVMNLLVEWVYAFSPGDRQRVDDCREYMVAKTKEALVEVGVLDEELNLGFKLANGITNATKSKKD